MSDPALVTSADGSVVVMEDLGVQDHISTEVSRDDGRSWPDASPVVSRPGESVDRPWLARAGSTYYLEYVITSTVAGAGQSRLRSSTDGLAWTDVSTFGDGTWLGGMVADPHDGTLYVGNGDKVWISRDAGKTFTSSTVHANGKYTGEIQAQPPALDASGVVYFAWSDLHQVWLASSRDHGASWSAPLALSSGNGTAIWPWPVAGDAGKVGVAWLEANESAPTSDAVKGDWIVHVAFLTDAQSSQPHVETQAVPGAIAMRGPICTDGTACEATGKDRRLGDFITCDIDKEGHLMIAYATTTTGHSVSSPMFVRQLVGTVLRG